MLVKTRYWHRLDDGRVVCDLCPRLCHLREGKRGACFVRQAQDGEIVLTTYGRSSGFCIDPIEKKPLNHFYPGSSVLSFGTAGCNLGCKFCQNWSISKSRQMDSLGEKASPEAIADAAVRYSCDSVAYTYNDPVIFLEYALDTAKACREKGVYSVAVSAGYILEPARADFFSQMDAVNLDLKAFSESFYRKLCSGHLEPVLDTLKYIYHHTQAWLEITTLLIPGENDSDAELNEMCGWIVSELGPDVPLHFTAFHPDFKLTDRPATPAASLLRARDIARACGLQFVYVGNVHASQADSTYCPQCRNKVIERDWYQLGAYQLDEQGRCLHCHHQLPGRFRRFSSGFGARRIPVRF